MVKRQKNISGFTLVEVLVVVSSFAILAVLVTLTIAASLKGSRKSETSSKVRTELEYALGFIERQVRNGTSLVCTPPDGIDFQDPDGVAAGYDRRLQTIDGVSQGYIASRSGTLWSHLTSSSIGITEFTVDCSDEIEDVPMSVAITLSGKDISGTGSGNSQVTIDTQIMLRDY